MNLVPMRIKNKKNRYKVIYYVILTLFSTIKDEVEAPVSLRTELVSLYSATSL